MNVIRRLWGEMETERLILRRWRPTDFNDFLKFIADPEVMAPSGAKPAGNFQEAEMEFRRAARDENCYAIVLKETGRPIGKIKFQEDLRRHREVNCMSVGYQLRKDLWGNGYMPEALHAMIDCAFRKKNLDLLAISHFSVNDRSRRVIEKCGFHREGVLRRGFRRYDGQIFDEVCYSILREEYLGEQGGPPMKNRGGTPDGA